MRSRDFCTFIAQNSKCPRCFWEVRSWCCAHVFNVLLPSPLRIFVCFFPLKMWECRIPFSLTMWSFRTQISQKIQKKQISDRGEKKTHSWRLGRGTLNTCAKKSGSCLSKAALTLDSEGIWGDKLEPACSLCNVMFYFLFFSSHLLPSPF